MRLLVLLLAVGAALGRPSDLTGLEHHHEHHPHHHADHAPAEQPTPGRFAAFELPVPRETAFELPIPGGGLLDFPLPVPRGARIVSVERADEDESVELPFGGGELAVRAARTPATDEADDESPEDVPLKPARRRLGESTRGAARERAGINRVPGGATVSRTSPKLAEEDTTSANRRRLSTGAAATSRRRGEDIAEELPRGDESEEDETRTETTNSETDRRLEAEAPEGRRRSDRLEADSAPELRRPRPTPAEPVEPTPYQFSYTAGRLFGQVDRVHSESRDEEGTVRGSFQYLDPLRQVVRVDYTADDEGYHPTISGAVPDALPKDTEEVAAARVRFFETVAAIMAEHERIGQLHSRMRAEKEARLAADADREQQRRNQVGTDAQPSGDTSEKPRAPSGAKTRPTADRARTDGRRRPAAKPRRPDVLPSSDAADDTGEKTSPRTRASQTGVTQEIAAAADETTGIDAVTTVRPSRRLQTVRRKQPLTTPTPGTTGAPDEEQKPAPTERAPARSTVRPSPRGLRRKRPFKTIAATTEALTTATERYTAAETTEEAEEAPVPGQEELKKEEAEEKEDVKTRRRLGRLTRRRLSRRLTEE